LEDFIEQLRDFVEQFQLYDEGDEYRNGYRNGYHDALVYVLDWAEEVAEV